MAGVEDKMQKIHRFEEFLDNKLKVQLEQVLNERDAIYTKISDYLEVKNTIQLIKDQNLRSMETLVNLGSDHFVQANIPDTSFIHIEIGLGFFAELTLDEGLEFIKTKNDALDKKALALTEKSTQIKAHIKLIYEGINEIMNS